MNSTCRFATVSEHAALEALLGRASLANPGDRDALVANPDAINLPVEQIQAGHVIVVERAARILGFAAVIPRADGQAELDALFVEPDVWRQGIGRQLVERCGSLARERGATTLHVVGNPHAERFYRSCGFESVGTIDTRFGHGTLFELRL